MTLSTEVDQEEDREPEHSLESCSTQTEVPTSKRVKVGSGGYVVVYNSEWEEELVPMRSNSGIVTGMLCRICKRHKTENKYNKSRVWSGTPCRCIRKDSVRRHSQSLQHKDGIEKELARGQSSHNGGLQQAFQTQVIRHGAKCCTQSPPCIGI